MSTQSNNCIVLFAKSPAQGKVKTRLAVEIGGEVTAPLYRCFVEDLMSTVEKLEVDLRFYFHPPEARRLFLHWLGEQRNYIAQSGDNLGERLKNAFADTFGQGFSNVVAIGSDSPDLPASFLRQAFEKLEINDAVVGPTSDGGYYLIGFSKESFTPEVFDGIAWSTSAVFNQTQRRLKANGLSIHTLPRWHDVDTRADLDRLIARNENTSFASSKTFAFIGQAQLRVPET